MEEQLHKNSHKYECVHFLALNSWNFFFKCKENLSKLIAFARGTKQNFKQILQKIEWHFKIIFGICSPCVFCCRSICGTPNYISPEVILKHGHSFPADIWAIGCIVYVHFLYI